jgi:hypothetical protein
MKYGNISYQLVQNPLAIVRFPSKILKIKPAET